MTSDLMPTREAPLPLSRMLADYAIRHPDDAAVVAEFRRFLGSSPATFERRHAVGHFTGSAFVVSADGERTLLMHHRKLGLWVQPGGHADGDPDLAAVALREAQETSTATRSRRAATSRNISTTTCVSSFVPPRARRSRSTRNRWHWRGGRSVRWRPTRRRTRRCGGWRADGSRAANRPRERAARAASHVSGWTAPPALRIRRSPSTLRCARR